MVRPRARPTNLEAAGPCGGILRFEARRRQARGGDSLTLLFEGCLILDPVSFLPSRTVCEHIGGRRGWVYGECGIAHAD